MALKGGKLGVGVLFAGLLLAFGVAGRLDYEDRRGQDCARAGKVYNADQDRCYGKTEKD